MDTVLSVDELLSSKLAERKEAGEIGLVHDQPAIGTEATSTSSKRTKTEMFKKLKEASSKRTKTEMFKKLKEAGVWLQDKYEIRSPKIQKVMYMLRKHKNFEKYCEPMVISFGPIHHGNPKYKIAEKYKLMLTYEFTRKIHNAEELYEAVEKNIKQLREYYDEEVTEWYNDEPLAWMLFVDGCALLQYIYSFDRGTFYELQIKNDLLAFARQDLFLLENQLPYQLLQDLIMLSGKQVVLNMLIDNFIQEHSMLHINPKGTTVSDFRRKHPKWMPIHLLDFLRTVLLGRINTNAPNASQMRLEAIDSIPNTQLLKAPGVSMRLESIPNMQQLKAAGVHLECDWFKLGLGNVSFTRVPDFYRGTLRLRAIIVDDSTGPMFFNLIAYEMCSDFKNDFGVISYISFLNSIIKEDNDVKELGKARILYNSFGSDQEVAQLFKELGKNLVPNPEIYADVRSKILEYHGGKLSKKCQFLYKICRNPPWMVISILLSVVALVVTAVQTWLTAIQTWSPGSGK